MHYHQAGQVPPKRHTVFRQASGELYAEELVSTEGFSSLYSLVYHLRPPTRVLRIDAPYSVAPEIAADRNMQHRNYSGFALAAEPDYLSSRKALLVNDDVYLHLAAPRAWGMDAFFRNSDAHELLFVHIGTGRLETAFGQLAFGPGDHLLVPKGTIYRMHFDTEENRLLIVESFGPLQSPTRYRNKWGQLLEHAPYCERDIRKPQWQEPVNEEGDFLVYTKKQDMMYGYHVASHPFDYAGWDGYHYPWAFSIHDFEPITGSLHQPPPVHQTFEAAQFVLCAFVPRLYDYHPLAVPAPYYHSNIDSDEVLYYVGGDFMSRKSVQPGMLTLHPMGVPHGPQPGAIERSIGAKSTNELAVMIDTFRPLKLTKTAMELENKDYYLSWL